MSPTKILITEDEILIARELELALQELGYWVVALASDGETALAKVAETQPDLVLMDIVIQGEQDGIETAQQIREQFQIPVIFLTAYADVDTLQRAKITEPFGYVLKPFQIQELNIAIQVGLARHQAEQFKLQTLRTSISAALPHEINTPLHGILGFTDLLLQYYDSMSPAEVLETLQCMRTSVLELERVSQNFLLHAKLEVIATQPLQMEQLRRGETSSTQDLIEYTAGKQARELNRSLDLKLELAELAAQMAEGYFRKVIEELLRNAFNFSEPGSEVLIRTSLQEQSFCISVADQGVGMAPEQVAQVGAYVQFDRDYFEQPGVGLGLALVQQLVKLHNGSLAIESRPGKGTTITVQLPLPQ